jgi:lauroyl/myristoyl acyltransferase
MIMAEFVKILIRLTPEQYAWLRQHCFDNRISQAEVLRQALELYRQELAKKE